MSPYTGEISEGCTSIADARTAIAERLRTMPHGSGNQAFAEVVIFYGSDPAYVFENLEHIVFPACIVWYKGSVYGNRPVRAINLSLLILCDSTGNWAQSDLEASAYVDDIYDVFHRRQFGDYLWAYLRSDNALNLSQHNACGYEVEIQLEDR